jgi:hypothetical protein
MRGELSFMPASKYRVETALQEVKKSADVFAIVYINGNYLDTFWSRPSDVRGATFKTGCAEYQFIDWFEKNYEVESGEIVAIDITIKWSPYSGCALRLPNLLQTKNNAAITLSCSYLDVFRENSAKFLSIGNPLDALKMSGIPCVPYEETADGKWWGGGNAIGTIK